MALASVLKANSDLDFIGVMVEVRYGNSGGGYAQMSVFFILVNSKGNASL